ncbi:MAG: hypothetical protein WCF67_18295 [Chitinophagaceae bacterium]
MERLSVLIHKLKEQFEENVPPSQMLATVHQLEAELSQMATRPAKGLGTAKVAVMMPSAVRPEVQFREPAREEKQYQPQPVREEKKSYQPQSLFEVVEQEPAAKTERNGHNGHHTTKKQEEPSWSFNPLEEIPTLSHQQDVREINDVMGINGSSLNDRLREEKVELAHVLTETPIRDLKKAIGINDRYVFLNELFRGDETMYERSLKTLNGFRIYQEAEYWINRELKIKLGWNDNNSIVRHFYQLVRRRFS